MTTSNEIPRTPPFSIASSSTSQSGSETTPTISDLAPDVPTAEKLLIEIDYMGRIVGPLENAKIWNKKAGDCIRRTIPVHITDWRKVDIGFKNTVWKALMLDFRFNIPEEKAREYMEKKLNGIWRTHKSNLRTSFTKRFSSIEAAVISTPKRVDPSHWREFVVNEFKPETIAANLKKSENRSHNTSGHTMGQLSYAKIKHAMDSANPGKQHTRDEVWEAAHLRSDGTILPSAIESYEKVKAVQEKRRMSGDAANDDISSDVLTEAFGKDKKRLRGLSNDMSLKQHKRVEVAKLIYEQTSTKNDEISELKLAMAKLESQNQQILNLFQQFSKSQMPTVTPPVNEPRSPPDLVPSTNAANQATPQNLMNMFEPVTRSNSSSNPKVELLSRQGLIVAKGYVATDVPSKTCHGKMILASEKRVYVEEVIIADAPIYERPQDGMMTLQEISEGGYLIWLDALLRYC